MSTTRTPRPTVTQDLWSIARHWGDLTEALTAHGGTWPPVMSTATLTHEPNSAEAEAATWRAEALRLLERNPEQPGWTAAPMRLGVFDAMVTVQAGLFALADQTAAAVQRPAISPAPVRRARPAPRPGSGFEFPARPETPRARAVQAADDARRDLLAMKDAADPRRWSQIDDRRRTVPHAALWLLARVQHTPGPVHRGLTPLETDRIASATRTAAHLVEHALDVGDEHVQIASPCPTCGGRLTLYGGGGAVPVVRCRECGGIW
ncbi:hypothetical protein [Streptomyces sp. NPDC088554]|uniref:hypothetical protein n=1 Tax=Streptomyces sp. NPDC088554 TaxID=3365865 RepID=UPI003827A25E